MVNNKRLKVLLSITIGIILFIFSLRWFTGELFYENRTSSAPQGIYLRSFGDLSYNDYVIVALDRDVAALKEGYLLLKQVKGFPGDVYIVGDGGVEINGKMFPVQHFQGLPRLPKGLYTVPEGTYLLMNEARDSFDSRYLGPMKQEQVRAKVRMLLPYNSLSWLFARKM